MATQPRILENTEKEPFKYLAENHTPREIAKYLTVALKQRERAAMKFTTDYGPNSATVAEISTEIARLRKLINELEG